MTPPRFRSAIELASLVVAPALMSTGDLMHPPESMDATEQVDIIVGAASRWYTAHLLLLAGMLLFVPGILLLTRTVARRRPALGYASRVLALAAVGALAAVFAFEMVQGSVASTLDRTASIALLETFNSRVLPILLPGLLAFFVGVGMIALTLASNAGALRWPAVAFALGALLILGEIATATVILSQVGNVLILLGGAGFANALRREGASG